VGDSSSVIYNSGIVTSWNDISGNGNNATQNTTDNHPFYISTVDGIEFDGFDVLLGNRKYKTIYLISIEFIMQPIQSK